VPPRQGCHTGDHTLAGLDAFDRSFTSRDPVDLNPIANSSQISFPDALLQPTPQSTHQDALLGLHVKKPGL